MTCDVLISGFSGSNLHYEIRYINDSINPLDELVKWLTGVYKRRKARDGGAEERHSAVSGLIYCSKVCVACGLYGVTLLIDDWLPIETNV